MLDTIKGQPISELESTVLGLGHSSYRAKQLFRWLYQRKLNHFDEMTDLSKDFREELKRRYDLPKLVIKEKRESEDGTVKYLVGLPDGHQVESVFIPQEGRNTLCVSTQVGCKMACSFCATGYMKFSRNLKSWEIVEQLVGLEFPAPVTNVVMMGMGEPFDNYEEVIKALKIMQDPMGPKIGKRHITVSTVGLVPKIQEFMDANLGKLAISLHGTTDEQRSRIMPINKKYPLAELMETCRTLTLKGRTRVTFEYVLLRDENDSEEDAHRLAKLVEKYSVQN